MNLAIGILQSVLRAILIPLIAFDNLLQEIAHSIVTTAGVEGNLAKALDFWIYDSLKITVILIAVIFAVGYLRTYLKPENVRRYLKGKHSIIGYFLAAVLGILSPFCSCSTIPIFLGFVGAGIPFGMTITFLAVSPMVNEAAVVVLLGVLGWEKTLMYVAGGVLVGVTGGFMLTRLGFEKYVDKMAFTPPMDVEEMSRKQRVQQAYKEAKSIVTEIMPYVIIGVGIGAIIHGYVPQESITKHLTGSFAVPAAVAVGIPIYTNIMGVIPVVESLIGKGLPVGTSLAFMMSVAALSLPQFVLLKKVMKKELITAYALMLGAGIIIMGLAFNFIF